MKTDIYNPIILGESGSMSGVTRQTISGCNETINTSAPHKKSMQTHKISVSAFMHSSQTDPDRPAILSRTGR